MVADRLHRLPSRLSGRPITSHQAARQLIDEVSHLPSRPQRDPVHMRRQVLHQRNVARPPLRRIRPNPSEQKRRIKPFLVADIGPITPEARDRSPNRAWKIDASRQVQPDNNLGPRQTHLQCAGIVAVHHPGVSRDPFSNGRPERRLTGLDPSGLPVQGIHVHNGNVEPRANITRQRGLPGTAWTDDENAARYTHGRKSFRLARTACASAMQGSSRTWRGVKTR